jgi:hypothetical protein
MKYFFRYKMLDPKTLIEYRSNPLRGTMRIKKKQLPAPRPAKGPSGSANTALYGLLILFIACLITIAYDYIRFKYLL